MGQCGITKFHSTNFLNLNRMGHTKFKGGITELDICRYLIVSVMTKQLFWRNLCQNGFLSILFVIKYLITNVNITNVNIMSIFCQYYLCAYIIKFGYYLLYLYIILYKCLWL